MQSLVVITPQMVSMQFYSPPWIGPHYKPAGIFTIKNKSSDRLAWRARCDVEGLSIVGGKGFVKGGESRRVLILVKKLELAMSGQTIGIHVDYSIDVTSSSYPLEVLDKKVDGTVEVRAQCVWKEGEPPMRSRGVRFMVSKIDISPTEVSIPCTGGLATVIIVSITQSRLAFKVKTSNNDCYRVKNVFGFIEPEAEVPLEILRLNGHPKDDKLIVQWAEVPAEETDPKAPFDAGAEQGEVTLPLKAV